MGAGTVFTLRTTDGIDWMVEGECGAVSRLLLVLQVLLPQGRGRGGASDAAAVGWAAIGVAAYAGEWREEEEEEGRSEEGDEERRWLKWFDVVGIGMGKGLKVEEEEGGMNEDDCGVGTGKLFIIVMPIIKIKLYIKIIDKRSFIFWIKSVLSLLCSFLQQV